MAVYKVIQDIEAEDKLLGPFSLRQFVYVIVTLLQCFIAYKLAALTPLLILPFLPGIILFGFLAAPLGHDQPSEIWLLAHIRFFLKPRRRVWNQSGLEELVTVTAPRKEVKRYTNGLSQKEVKSRLQALAETIDSRGWAVKNVDVNMYNRFGYNTGAGVSDRLVDASALPQQVSNIDIGAADDIMDEQNNPTAQHFDQLIHASDQAHRQRIIESMKNPQAAHGQQPGQAPLDPTQLWFMQPKTEDVPNNTTFISQVVSPDSAQAPAMPVPETSDVSNETADEQALLKKIHKEEQLQSEYMSRMKVIKTPQGQQAEVAHPQTQQAAQTTQENTATPPMTAQPDPDILRLANNDDLDVATLARQANRHRKQEPPDDEVVISLH